MEELNSMYTEVLVEIAVSRKKHVFTIEDQWGTRFKSLLWVVPCCFHSTFIFMRLTLHRQITFLCLRCVRVSAS